MRTIFINILIYIHFLIINAFPQISDWLVFKVTNTGIQTNTYAAAVSKHNEIYFLTGESQLIKYDGLFYNVRLKIPNIQNNSIKKIIFDRFNNLWFLTYGFGLIKYDGSDFIFFNSNNSGLSDNDINDISFDSLNNIWVATNNKGLFKFDGNNWTRYWTGNSGIPDNQITTIHVDKLNRKWVGTKTPGQVAFYDDLNWYVFNRTNSGIDGEIFRIVSDDSNHIWIGTSMGISKFDGINFQHFFYTRGNWFKDIIIDNQKRIWFGGKGIVFYSNGIWTELNDYFPYGIINDAIVNNLINIEDSVYVFTNNLGIFKIYDSSYIQLNNLNTGIRNNYIKAILVYDKNFYWLGTYSSGITQLESLKDTIVWKSLLHKTIIYAIKKDKHNNIWVGTYNKGLYKYNGVTWDTFTTSNSYLPSNNISCLSIDSNGIIWIGTDKGLVNYDGINWTVYNTNNSDIPGNFISSIVIDNFNNKWIGTENGLAKFDGITWTVFTTSNSGLPDNLIISLEMDKNGVLWIGTYDYGLIKYDGISWTIYNSSNSGLPSNRIRVIKADTIGYLWIGTENSGLAKFDGFNWQIFNTFNSELSSNFITSIEIDQFNHKIIGTNNGLNIYREGGVILSVSEKQPKSLLNSFRLEQNYPNPFNSTTKINFYLPEASFVNITIYNSLGEEIINLLNEEKSTGHYEIEFNASNLPSGVYFYRMRAGKYLETKKMLLIK